MVSKGQGKRVTISDVAKRAGVGTASVDRVINDRGNVSEEVSRRVLQAAKELGLRRLLPQEGHKRCVVGGRGQTSMAIKIGAPREIAAGAARVALTPDSAVQLSKLGYSSIVETGAGVAAAAGRAPDREQSVNYLPEIR